MPRPEYPTGGPEQPDFNRAHSVRRPRPPPAELGNAFSGPTGVENSSQSLPPTNSLSEAEQVSPGLPESPINHLKHKLPFAGFPATPGMWGEFYQSQINGQQPDPDHWSETGYPPPIAGGQEKKRLEGSPDQPGFSEERGEDASQGGAENSGSEQERRTEARDLGLHENASWAEISAAGDEHERAAITQVLGLPTYPAAKEYGFSEYPSWRNILMAVLGLKTTASPEDIIARIGEVRREDKEQD